MSDARTLDGVFFFFLMGINLVVFLILAATGLTGHIDATRHCERGETTICSSFVFLSADYFSLMSMKDGLEGKAIELMCLGRR